MNYYNLTVKSPLNGEPIKFIMIPASKIFFAHDGNHWMRWDSTLTCEILKLEPVRGIW